MSVTRVLLVYQPTDGGVGRHVRDLAEGLTERGHDAILCGPGAPAGTDPALIHQPLALDRAVDPGADVAAATRLAGLIRRYHPDLIHAHSSKAGAIARLARIAHPRVPLIYSPHLYAFAGFFQRRGERLAYRALEHALAPLANRVICVCEAEAVLARSVGSPGRVRVVHNGIEPPGDVVVDPRIAALAARGPLVGTLSHLQPRKGLDTLIDAAPALRRRFPDVQIAIVGEGPERAGLQRRAVAADAFDMLHMLGPSEEPLSVLAGLDVFVLPSRAEAFPYSILEAMVMGRAIVATDVGGVGEAVLNDRTGLLSAPGDAGALGTAIATLLDDPPLRTRLGNAARQRAEQHFGLAGMVDGVIRVYDEMLS